MDRSRYTVAWIAPLPLELIAARSALEQEFEDIHVNGDRYYGGKIGAHNIVLAVQHTMGTDAASDLAARMQASFPSLKFFLVVGIGGGVPRYGVSGASSEMVLGDVVVSYPWGNYGGVVRYDSGAWVGEDEGRLNFVGHTNAPPSVLLGAVNNLRADHGTKKRYDTMIPIFLEDMRLKINDSERSLFDDPGAQQDRLYADEYTHPPSSQGVDCQQCCDPNFLRRHQRGKSARRAKDTPKIHYGNVGSSNQLQISPAERNRLHAEHNIICFEMEGAGVIHRHPCLIVRGICDYSDSHKNKVWQPYAAVTAAAYTKELLKSMPAFNIALEDGLRATKDNQTRELLARLGVTDPRHDKKRIEGTKGGLLEASYRWILENSIFQQWRDDNDQSRLLWIKGDPGKGKTMLLCGIINELEKSADRLAYFFCQATDSRINTGTAILRGLLYVLIDQQPTLSSHFQEKFKSSNDDGVKDVNAWYELSEIFTNILQDVSQSLSNTYLIIDALDECVAELPLLLNFLVQISSRFSHIRWIVSSRNIRNIEQRLPAHDSRVRLSLELKEHAVRVSHAVDIYIDHCISELAEYQGYDQTLWGKVKKKLQEKANGTFLWVSLAVKELKEVMALDALEILEEIPTDLKDVYYRMLAIISNLQRQYPARCHQVLRNVLTAYRPLHLSELFALSDLSIDDQNAEEAMAAIVNMCGSFLTIKEKYVYIIHQSAKDFLATEAHYLIFTEEFQDPHRLIFTKSLQIMARSLHRDIYSLNAPGFPIEQVKPPDPDPLESCRYSCIYWIDHLVESGLNLQDAAALEEFFGQKYLNWLEALSLCKSIPKAVTLIKKLEVLIRKIAKTALLENVLHDARRFIIYHKSTIEKNPLQIYISALLFTPRHSFTRKSFSGDEPHWIPIKPAMDDHWSVCLQTLDGERSPVTEMVFSPDSTRLATASGEQEVKIWDMTTSDCMHTLSCDWSNSSIAFSPDSAWLAIGCRFTLKIWDVETGNCLKSIQDGQGFISSLIFCDQPPKLVLVFNDGTIKIWDLSRGYYLHALEDPSNAISVKVTGDQRWDSFLGQQSALAQFAGSIRLAVIEDRNHVVSIWDVNSGERVQILRGVSSDINSLAFSHDLAWLATASKDDIIKIWDVAKGTSFELLGKHYLSVTSIAFSHNSKHLASASRDRTIKLWDCNSGNCIQTLTGHSSGVCSLAFSHDSNLLVSGSLDRTVKIWDTSCEYPSKKLSTPFRFVNIFAFSPNSARLASAYIHEPIEIWDTISGSRIHTIVYSNSPSRASVNSMAFTHDSANLAVGYRNSYPDTIHIWDIDNGACFRKFKHNSSASSLAFSSDSTWLASAHGSMIIIWDVDSGLCIQTIMAYGGPIRSLAFSHSSSWLASSTDAIKIWDVSNGQLLYTIETTWRRIRHIAFDASGSRIYTELGVIEINGLFRSTDLAPDSESRTVKLPCTPLVNLSSDGTWIRCGLEKLVSIPVEYEPQYVAVLEGMIGVCTRNGRLWICKVKPDDMLVQKAYTMPLGGGRLPNLLVPYREEERVA